MKVRGEATRRDFLKLATATAAVAAAVPARSAQAADERLGHMAAAVGEGAQACPLPARPVELGQLLVLAALVPALDLLFRFVVAERIGTIISTPAKEER